MKLSLGVRLMVVVGVLASVIFGIVGATWWVTRAQAADAVVINVAGRQRMLVQKLTKAVLGYVIALREIEAARRNAELFVQGGGFATAHGDPMDVADAAESPAGAPVTGRGFGPKVGARSADDEFLIRGISGHVEAGSPFAPDEYEALVLGGMREDVEGWRGREWVERVNREDRMWARYLRPVYQAVDGTANFDGTGKWVGAVSLSWPTETKGAEDHKAEAVAAAKLFGESLDALRGGGATTLDELKPILPACAVPAIAAQLAQVGAHWDSFSKNLNVLLGDGSDDTPEFIPALNALLEQNLVLLREMNIAVAMFQAESDGRIALLSTVQSAAAGLTVLILVAVGLYLRRRITRPINEVIAGLNEGANQVRDAAAQVASTSQSLAAGATQQSSSLQETTSAMEQMASMTRSSAENAGQANELSGKTRAAAQAGDQTVRKLHAAMTAINDSSDQISKIIKVIEEIAFQTNLLALNAAVEAARAGEHGKGFAVVADEVRNLAQRAAQAARETTGLIEVSVSRAREGSNVATAVANALTQIVGNVETTNELIGAISQASREQALGVEQINSAMSQMDKVTQQNAAGAEESAAAAEELSAQASTLKSVVEELTVIVRGGSPRSLDDETATARTANF